MLGARFARIGFGGVAPVQPFLDLVEALVDKEQVLDQMANGLLLGQFAAGPTLAQVRWGVRGQG